MYTTEQFEGIIAETITINGTNGDAIHTYFARPMGAGPFPAVVLAHHLPGWDELYREFTRKLAHHGYLAISPDLYCREAHGTPEDVAAAVRADGGVSDDQVMGDLEAAAKYVLSLPNSNGKVGTFGTCSGGRHVFLAGCRLDCFDAIVECWGGNVIMSDEQLTDKQPVSPNSYTQDLNAPLLGIFGDLDQKLRAKRLETPRVRVPKGSIGLTEQFCNIYTYESPGGWNIIGNTPIKIFDKSNISNPTLINPGDTVKFYKITKEEYINWNE